MKKAERMHNCMQTDWNNNKTEYKLMFTCISARTQKWYTSWLKKQQIKQIQNGTHADWNYLKKKNVLTWVGWGKGPILLLCLTPPSKKTFYEGDLWMTHAQEGLQYHYTGASSCLLGIPSRSPPLPCMRLEGKTKQSCHLLSPTNPQWKAEVIIRQVLGSFSVPLWMFLSTWLVR